MNTLTFCVTLAVVSLVLDREAHAYLDPGTGSMVFQAIIALFLGAAATGKLWWSKVKGIFSKTSAKREDND